MLTKHAQIIGGHQKVTDTTVFTEKRYNNKFTVLLTLVTYLVTG